MCIPDARLRSLFSLLLADSEAQVTSCSNGDEFQRILATRFHDLCVFTLDAAADMPAFVKAVRHLSAGSRILLIVNRDEVERMIPLVALGISEVLLQPINPKRAISVIQNLVSTERAEPAAAGAAAEGEEAVQAPPDGAGRTRHVIARSPAMRAVVSRLWQARQEPLGILLRGEPGTEFELLAREYQAICGDPGGFLRVLSHAEVTTEGLATVTSLDRLNDGRPLTFLIEDLERLPSSQQAQLLDFLRLARRRRERDRPLHFVFTAAECDEDGRNLDLPFIEELLFLVPVVVKVPALRDRRADIEPMARRLVLDLTAIYPEYRVRSLSASAIEWLGGRLWRGNHGEFSAFLRKMIEECPSRELSAAYFTARHSPGAPMSYRPHGASKAAPADAALTATSSHDTTVATTVPPKPGEAPPAAGARPQGRLTAKELLATIR